MKPFKQGDLDGLCGVYSIINALSFINGKNEDESEKLFHDYIDFLDAKPHRIAEFIKNGIPKYVMKELLEEYDRNVLEFHVKLPNLSRDTPMEKYWEWLETRLAFHKNSCAILGLNDPWNHWTVVTRINDKTVEFLDSSTLKRRRKTDFVINTNQKTDSIKIDAGCCFFVWKGEKYAWVD